MSMTTTERGLIEVKLPEEQLAVLEAVANECSLQALGDTKSFMRTFKLAAGIRALKKAITPDMMRDIMELQGTSLGFRTDKDTSGGYHADAVKECLIEATLRGAYCVGNEFNIIAGRCYLTKEYFTRKVAEFPGLTELKLFPGVPATMQGGALVPYVVSWKLNGKADRLERLLKKIDEGTQLDERICVRVNAGMGADAILGKAQRKVLAAVYARLTGSDPGPDADAEESPAPLALPSSLDSLTDKLTATNGNGHKEPTSEAAQDSTAAKPGDPEGPSLSEELDAAIAKLGNLTMQGDVNQMQANVVQRLGLTGDLAAKWAEACEERKLAIRASRQKGGVS